MKLKKMVALLMACTMISGMAISASALTEGNADPGDLKITVSEAATVDAYQILQQNLTTGAWELTDWAKAALGTDADRALSALTNYDNSNKKAIAQYLNTLKNAAASQTAISVSSSAAGDVIVDTDNLGSYLVVVTSENYTYTNMVVNNYDNTAEGGLCVGTATAKGVKDNIIDSKTASDDQVAVGDVVTYTVTGEMPDFRGTTDPALKIVDTMSANVEIVIPQAEEGQSAKTIQDAVTVKVGGSVISSDKYSVTAATAPGVGFTLEFKSDYLKDNADTINNAAIELTYDVKVKTYDATNKYSNKITGEYNIDGSSKPFDGPDEDVFTAALKLTKKNADNEKLALAEFKLQSSNNDGYVKVENGVVTTTATEDQATVFTTDENGEITIQGLDPQYTYTIIETKAPQGYQKAGSATITFTDVQSDEAADGKYTAALTGDTNAYTVTTTTESEVVGVDVTDTRLGALPNTGGVGIAVVTVAGVGAMLAFGGSFVALRKRIQK